MFTHLCLAIMSLSSNEVILVILAHSGSVWCLLLNRFSINILARMPHGWLFVHITLYQETLLNNIVTMTWDKLCTMGLTFYSATFYIMLCQDSSMNVYLILHFYIWESIPFTVGVCGILLLWPEEEHLFP